MSHNIIILTQILHPLITGLGVRPTSSSPQLSPSELCSKASNCPYPPPSPPWAIRQTRLPGRRPCWPVSRRRRLSDRALMSSSTGPSARPGEPTPLPLPPPPPLLALQIGRPREGLLCHCLPNAPPGPPRSSAWDPIALPLLTAGRAVPRELGRGDSWMTSPEASLHPLAPSPADAAARTTTYPRPAGPHLLPGLSGGATRASRGPPDASDRP